MDVVLEVFDTFLFDPVYATLLPASPVSYGFSFPPQATFSSMREAPTPVYNGYKYEPATAYISFEPSEYAYMSRWQRDHWARQATSLFLITW